MRDSHGRVSATPGPPDHRFFDALLQSIDDGAWSATLDGSRITYVNPAVERIYGRPREAFLTNASLWIEAVHPEDQAHVVELSRALLCGERRAVMLEYRVVRPGGEVRWVEDRKAVVCDEQDQPLYLAGLLSDITERKLREAAVEEADRRYRLLATHSTDIISVYTPDAICQYISPACTSLLGREPEEVVGQDIYAFFHPEDMPEVRRFHEAVLASQQVRTGSWRIRHKDGHFVWMETTSKSICKPDAGEVEQIIAVTRDITERIEAENQLRFQSQLLESVRESVVACDVEGRVIYWGKGAEVLYGYTTAEMLGQSFEAILRPEAVSDQQARLQHALRYGCWAGQHLQQRRNGALFWADTFISAIRDAEGHVMGTIGIDRDITERKRTEEQLETRTQELLAITENAPDLIARVNRELRQLFLSRAFSRVTGIAQNAYLGKTCEELGMPPQFCRRWNQSLREVFETGRAVQMEFELEREGTTHYFEALLAPETRREREVETAVVIARDVTEQRQVDQQLKEAEERFRAFMEHSPTAAFIKDADGRYVYCNQAVQRLAPLVVGPVVGKTDWDLFPSETAAKLRANDREVLAANCTIEHSENVPTTLGMREFLVVKFPLSDSSGRPFVGGMAIDMTERRKAEEELQQHHATLAHVARLSTMGEMVAGIAHEIAQPLSAISNFAGASKQTLTGPDGNVEKVRHWVNLIGEQAQRAGAIIDRLRRFVRGSEPQRSPCRLNELIRDSIKLVTAELKRYGVPLRVDLTSPGPRVLADGVQIQQVLVNLLRNACEAMADTPADRREIVVRTVLTDEQVEVLVRDRGVGLPADDPGQVLHAFYTTKPGGMGMGLAVSRRIIDAHGGRLWATPNSRRGTSFHFTLPIHAEQSHDA